MSRTNIWAAKTSAETTERLRLNCADDKRSKPHYMVYMWWYLRAPSRGLKYSGFHGPHPLYAKMTGISLIEPVISLMHWFHWINVQWRKLSICVSIDLHFRSTCASSVQLFYTILGVWQQYYCTFVGSLLILIRSSGRFRPDSKGKRYTISRYDLLVSWNFRNCAQQSETDCVKVFCCTYFIKLEQNEHYYFPLSVSICL